MTAMLTAHVLDTCRQCGQTDDHPKVHLGYAARVDSYHHDCVAMADQAQIFGGNHGQHPLLTAKIFKQAVDGTRGDDLRDFIQSQTMRDFGDAQMLKYTTYANDVLDQVYNGAASGSIVIGATTYTAPFKVRFLSTLSVAATPGTQWSGGSYPAGGVSLSGNFTSAASAATKASTGAVTVTNAPATTWADNDITDSTGTPKPVTFKGTPSLGKTVNAADTCTIAIGSLTGNES